MRVLITGAAGFIGSHVSAELLEQGNEVVAVDRLSPYYSVELKRWRFEKLTQGRIPLIEHDLSCWPFPPVLMREYDAIINLAAQPGVRLGIEDSSLYVSDNIAAFMNVLRFASDVQPKTILYASSSSVYGDEATAPFSESERSLNTLSLYGTTKLHNEQVARVFKNLFEGEICGLRFFSVYGTWGRPDMAYWKVARALRNKIPFQLFGNGSVKRDFTHISDVVASLVALLDRERNPVLPDVLNIGGQHTRSIRDVLTIIENSVGGTLIVEEHPPLKEDAKQTMADPHLLSTLVGLVPEISLEQGLADFSQWYLEEAHARGAFWDQQGL